MKCAHHVAALAQLRGDPFGLVQRVLHAQGTIQRMRRDGDAPESAASGCGGEALGHAGGGIGVAIMHDAADGGLAARRDEQHGLKTCPGTEGPCGLAFVQMTPVLRHEADDGHACGAFQIPSAANAPVEQG